MSYLWVCLLVLVSAYMINILYVTIFYHRALAHKAVVMKPWLKSFVIHSGSWITGIDPLGWVCMHRMHHLYSDTPQDPHSPVGRGIWKVFPAQLFAYKKTLAGLITRRKTYTSVVSDLDFKVSWLNTRQLWYVPYLLHATIAVIIGFTFQAWLLAGCYWIGIMSHPIQGWMVNALAHRFGYRNFETPDNSKNNSAVAWLVFGEGYQNNHHHAPNSADFSVKAWEVDLGYGVCLAMSQLGLLNIPGEKKLTTQTA